MRIYVGNYRFGPTQFVGPCKWSGTQVYGTPLAKIVDIENLLPSLLGGTINMHCVLKFHLIIYIWKHLIYSTSGSLCNIPESYLLMRGHQGTITRILGTGTSPTMWWTKQKGSDSSRHFNRKQRCWLYPKISLIFGNASQCRPILFLQPLLWMQFTPWKINRCIKFGSFLIFAKSNVTAL